MWNTQSFKNGTNMCIFYMDVSLYEYNFNWHIKRGTINPSSFPPFITVVFYYFPYLPSSILILLVLLHFYLHITSMFSKPHYFSEDPISILNTSLKQEVLLLYHWKTWKMVKLLMIHHELYLSYLLKTCPVNLYIF